MKTDESGPIGKLNETAHSALPHRGRTAGCVYYCVYYLNIIIIKRREPRRDTRSRA